MDAATSTLNHPFNMGPSFPHGNPQTQGSANANQGHSSAPFPEEHHKPFFYIQPSQPYLPMQGVQWPMPMALPMSYSPYYGYPGFGYGMPLMPHYQPHPYVESPGFVIPHTHLHLMDYRRMLNPQYYHSMAFHARRLRYQQHNGPSRGVTSSEVQTEPLPAAQRTSTPSSNNSETSTETSNLSTALSVQKDKRSLALKDLAPLSTNATPVKGSFVIETEEVRIECCTTPAGLQVLHSRETAEMSNSYSQDMVKCSSIVQSGLLPEDNVRVLNTNAKMEQSRQACPDNLPLGTPSSNDETSALETTFTNHLGSKMAANVKRIATKEDLKVVHLPFDAKYLEELWKMESKVWSVEDILVPSPEYLIESCNENLPAGHPSAETLIICEENAQDEVVPIVKMPLTMEKELQDVVPTLELSINELAHEDVPKQCSIKERMEIERSPNLLLAGDLPLDQNIQDLQDTSFESLPAYLPSTSWLADFERIRYCKMPPTPQKLTKTMGNRSLDVPARRRKLDDEFGDVTAIRKPKERYKPKGKVDRRSLSDHECCINQSYNENVFTPQPLKGRRLCTRCSTKQRVYDTSPSSGIERQVLKHKIALFQPCNDVILPTCEACKGHAKKTFASKGSSPDIRVETEGELSETGLGRKWRSMDMRKDLKRPLALKQNVEMCPAVVYPKLKDKNCLCNQHQTQWHRIYHCPHGNAIQETDVNCAVPMSVHDKWSNVDQVYLTHRCQTEKSWKDVMPRRNAEGLKNEMRAQHLNKHNKSLSLSQGVHIRDTQC